MTYQPRPIDASHVSLDPQLDELIERLAANNHEHWALQRIADGWRFGPARSDTLKTHPGLVPYEELPESEKEYDRNTARQVLKATIALGYRIGKATDGAS